MRLEIRLLPAVVLLFAAGCGMEAVDTRVQARSEMALESDIHPVVITEGEWVCPHFVSVSNQPFNEKSAAQGEVEDQFGPFVACNTVVPAGEGTCSNCNQKYRTDGGEAPEGDDVVPMALPKMSCPHCQEVLDPLASLVRESKAATLGPSACPKCRRYISVVASDILTAVAVPEQIICPGCKQPIDPLMNACTNSSCRLGGVVRNVETFEGPCWRCGGLSDCPNCSGSGRGTQGAYGQTPIQCWLCGETGKCPECDESGFTVYEGVLPSQYTAWGREGSLPSAQRKWKFEESAPSGGGGDSGDDLGGEEDLGGDGG